MNPADFSEHLVVRLPHTDAAGVIFYPKVFEIEQELFERWLELGGFSLRDMLSGRLAPTPIVHCEADYRLPVRAGDKRIILVDGKPAGAILRVPAQGESRANMHVGGKAIKTALTKREIEICETIGPELAKRGQIFVGIDVIGDWLTEINVTSPTGIHEVRRFDGTDIAVLIWDAIEKRRR